jgi:hypothetical protein
MPRNPQHSVPAPPTKAEAKADARADASGQLLAQLEKAAMAGDGLTVLKLGDSADWSTLTAEEFATAVRLVLRVNAVQLARQLSALGAERYPDDAELQKIAYVLAPPRVIAQGQADPCADDNIQWLKENRQRYRGKWVALRDGELLAVADSPLQLQEQVGPLKGTRIMVTSLW